LPGVKQLKLAGLYSNKRLITRNLHEGTFTTWSVWEAWQEDLHRYLRADWSKADAKTIKGLQAVASLVRREQDAIRNVLSEPHHPMTTGRTEDYLDDIQRALGDRRRSFRNLGRLNDCSR
jgi:hypothetical protein